MSFNTVDAPTLRKWLDNNSAIIVDVREPAEYQEACIAGATLIPLGTLITKLLPPNPENKKLVMQCRSGGRSGKACEILLKDNPELEVYNLIGGILAWIDGGNPVNGNNAITGSCAVK